MAHNSTKSRQAWKRSSIALLEMQPVLVDTTNWHGDPGRHEILKLIKWRCVLGKYPAGHADTTKYICPGSTEFVNPTLYIYDWDDGGKI